MQSNHQEISAREKVYGYLLKLMREGVLLPGSTLNLKDISKKLEMSSTPLRDSLIKLEAEGFLTIYPRSKVVINSLEYEDFPFLYGTIGTLESLLITSSINTYTASDLNYLYAKNDEMEKALNEGDMILYDKCHYEFHNVFIEHGKNRFAERIITPIKNRLWDFPRKNFIKEWYQNAIKEHTQIVDSIKEKNAAKLEYIIKQIHWGTDYNLHYIKKVYGVSQKQEHQ